MLREPGCGGGCSADGTEAQARVTPRGKAAQWPGGFGSAPWPPQVGGNCEPARESSGVECTRRVALAFLDNSELDARSRDDVLCLRLNTSWPEDGRAIRVISFSSCSNKCSFCRLNSASRRFKLLKWFSNWCLVVTRFFVSSCDRASMRPAPPRAGISGARAGLPLLRHLLAHQLEVGPRAPR